MDQLPDIVLLDIFENLFYVDLCKCAQVCQRWYDLVHSLRFKKKIIVKALKDPWQLPLLVQYHVQERLEEFELWNDMSNPYQNFISREIVRVLRTSAPQLKKLVLAACTFDVVTLSDMPASLKYLSIRGSDIDTLAFFSIHPQSYEHHLTCLDVSGVSGFRTYEYLEPLAELKSLRCLFMENCSLVDGSIDAIIPLLSHLEVLDVEGTYISSIGVLAIIEHGSLLKELYIGHVRVCDFQHCSVFQEGHFDKLMKLRTLCVRNTRVTAFTLKKFANSKVKIQNGPNVSDACDKFTTEKLALVGFNSCNHYLRHVCCS